MGEQERWGSRVGVILAVAGSAVGLGNFLRFPGTAHANGGGAFMIPYFIAFLLLGIPVGWAEWTMGRYGGRKGFHSLPAIMGVVGKGRFFRYVGVIGALIPLVVYMYYILIEAWCLRYALAYLTGGIDLGTEPSGYVAASQAFFAKTTGIEQDGIMLASGGLDPALGFWAAVFVLNSYLVYRGLSGGIEKVCNWALPTMAVCSLIVLTRVLTLGTPDPAFPERSVVNGLGFMWNPDFSKLGNFDTWLAAAGQIFFSLSVGFGVIMNYSSYLSKRDDVVLSGLTSSATNELFEVAFGGLITLTAAFVFLGASGTTGGTFGLGFNTLPVVFESMGAIGPLIGGLWFFTLFLAAITSSLSMLQPVKAFFVEALGISSARAVVLISLLGGMGSLWVIWFSKDLTALDTMDFWVGTTLIFILATVQIIAFGWVFGVDRGLAEAHQGALLRIPRVFRFIIKYVAPTYLLIVFVGFCVQNLPGYVEGLGKNPVARFTLYVIAAVIALLLFVVRQGEKRWIETGMDLDGREPPND
jgi:NSS family neurotransmitter:Na+ symporter